MADARARHHRGRHVGDDRIGVGNRKAGADRVGAEQPFGAAGRRDRRHGVGEGEADEPLFGGTVGIIAGGAEMTAPAHRHGAKPLGLGDVDGHIDGAPARHQAEPVVGVEHGAAGHRLGDREVRPTLDRAIEQPPRVKRQMHGAMRIGAVQLRPHRDFGGDAGVLAHNATRYEDV